MEASKGKEQARSPGEEGGVKPEEEVLNSKLANLTVMLSKVEECFEIAYKTDMPNSVISSLSDLKEAIEKVLSRILLRKYLKERELRWKEAGGI